MISKEKWDALHARLEKLHVKMTDLTIKAVLGSGPGGQKVNKSATTIYIKHHPTGLEVKCGSERSQTLNHYYALTRLCEKLEEKIEGKLSQKAQEIAKIRHQKQRRKRRTQKKLVEAKRIQTDKKEFRKVPDQDQT